MTGIYYADMLDVLAAAGCQVAENETTAGWQTRARSSGGFPSPPLAVWWHHTASDTSPANDLAWMIDGSDDAPIGNLLLDRTGTFWPVAAGASNCAGKGGPATFSRGTVPADGGNTRGWQLEVANNGLGERWPQAQIDAYLRGSNALNAHVGNLPTDVITHHVWAPDRKIDPAAAAAVEGPWKPRSCTSSGTWHLDDIRAECARRADGAIVPTPPTPTPEPTPEPTPPPEEDWMADLPTITNGASGPDVKRMQHLLAAAGYMDEANPANYDGVWGSGTDGAKARFDNDHGLGPSPPTDCGTKSWESLMTGRVW